ncbi:hypothetical protein OIO90_005160 [Microbotryomycetes sp. JL221]|nr:hypothetical protein OIO90_005160 [Microbotryomycetes sp. JL221]
MSYTRLSLSSNDCTLSLETVSKHHARITVETKEPYSAVLEVLGVNGIAFKSKWLSKGENVDLNSGDVFSICDRRFEWLGASYAPFTVDSPHNPTCPAETEDEQSFVHHSIPMGSSLDQSMNISTAEDVLTWDTPGSEPATPAAHLDLPATPALHNRQPAAYAANALSRRVSLHLTITPAKCTSPLKMMTTSALSGSPPRQASPARRSVASPRSSTSRRVSELLLSPSDSFHRLPSEEQLVAHDDEGSSSEDDDEDDLGAPTTILTSQEISTPPRPALQRSHSLREKLLIKSAQKSVRLQSIEPKDSVAGEETVENVHLQPPMMATSITRSVNGGAMPPPTADSTRMSLPADLKFAPSRSLALPETPVVSRGPRPSATQTPPRSALRKSSSSSSLRRRSFFGFFSTPPSTLRRKVSFNDQLFIKEFVTVRTEYRSASPPSQQPVQCVSPTQSPTPVLADEKDPQATPQSKCAMEQAQDPQVGLPDEALLTENASSWTPGARESTRSTRVIAATCTPNMSAGLRLLFKQPTVPRTPQFVGIRSLFNENARTPASPRFDGLKEMLESPQPRPTPPSQLETAATEQAGSSTGDFEQQVAKVTVDDTELVKSHAGQSRAEAETGTSTDLIPEEPVKPRTRGESEKPS